ncbi:ATP-binding protein [Paenibacillus puldeungensis]|uniref:histidine kinase n=1 Tax=Paenibacillus puldeungensis TaxID=696536 RepID=A0ABW3S1T3_9BACL
MIRNLKNSLSLKIFLITFLMLFSVCALTYGFIAWVMPMTYTDDLNNKLDAYAQQLVEQLEQSTLEDCDPLLTRFSNAYDAALIITNEQGERVKASGNSLPTDHSGKATGGRMLFKMESIEYEGAEGGPVVKTSISSASTYPFSFSNGSEKYTLTVVGSVRAVNQAIQALGRIWPWLLIAVLLVSLFGSLFYVRYVTRPIVKISDIAQKMSRLEFNYYCDDRRGDEIGALGRSLNGLSDKLSFALTELRAANASLQQDIDKEREQEQRRLEFFSAVSHELKTPITVIKGQLEGMLAQVGVYQDRDKYLSRSLKVAKRMEGLVQEILTVSRMESSHYSLRNKGFDFSSLVRRKIEQFADLLEQKEMHLHVDMREPLFVRGDSDLLQKVIENLLSNAAFYSPPGEKITVLASKQENHICFSVENSGVRIPEEALPHLFEAFYRVEQSRNRQTGGSGLGLYLVKMILDRHSVSYQMENTTEGVRFSMQFPDQDASS